MSLRAVVGIERNTKEIKREKLDRSSQQAAVEALQFADDLVGRYKMEDQDGCRRKNSNGRNGVECRNDAKWK